MKQQKQLFLLVLCLFFIIGFFGCKSEESSDGSDDNTNTPFKLTGNWPFIDGNGSNGINYDASRDANTPNAIEFDSKLYATWSENDGTADQIIVQYYDGTNWQNSMGGAVSLNFDSDGTADSPNATVLNSKLYITWTEDLCIEGCNNNVRVKEWDKTSWSFIDGSSDTGLNYSSITQANNPNMVAFNNMLYVGWSEYSNNNESNQIRVKEWNPSTSSWMFKDSGGDDGVNKFTNENANTPKLIDFDSTLYGIWSEGSSGVDKIRIKKWDGGSVWTSADVSGDPGLNYNSSRSATVPDAAVFDSKLYITWQENYIIRVKEWNKTDWRFIDGSSDTGLNYNGSFRAENPKLMVYNNKLIVTWQEKQFFGEEVVDARAEEIPPSSTSQIRIKEWNGTEWRSVDGAGNNGINYNIDEAAINPGLATFGSALLNIWEEENSRINQIRVAGGELEEE